MQAGGLVCQSARNFDPRSASKTGSDSLLMNLRRRCGLVLRGNQGHAVFSRLKVAPHGVLRGWCVERRRQRRPYNPRDEREQFVPIMWRGFGRVHSRYPRRLADLPIAGRRAVLMLQARRFRCAAVLCERRIFTERFDDNNPQALGASHGSSRSDCPAS
jgi:hypothetical protein